MGLTALWALAALPLSAQIGLPSPELAPRVDRVEIERGGTLRVLLTVEIPGDLKVQANKPADPSLIPTVLTFDDVAQVEATEVVFPEPTTTKVLGFDEPLLVYRGQFPIGATLEVADDAPLGPTTLRAEFRYQACDETTCYFPQTLDTSWTFDVVENPSAGHQVPDAFDQVAFGTGEPPPVRALAELTALGRHEQAGPPGDVSRPFQNFGSPSGGRRRDTAPSPRSLPESARPCIPPRRPPPD